MPMSFRNSLWLHAALLLVGPGCSTVEKPDSPEQIRKSMTYGHVVLMRVEQHLGQSQPFVSVSGTFVNHINLSAEKASRILRLKAGDWQRNLTVGACQVFEQDLREIARLDPNDVQLWLLDVGRLSVSLDSRRIALDYENFPDIWPQIAGVTYRNRQVDALPFRTGQLYTVRLEGHDNSDVVVQVLAPSDLRLLGVGTPDEKPTEGERLVDFSRDLPVYWNLPERESGDFLLKVERIQAQRIFTVLCRARDDGHFVIPASTLQKLPIADGDAETRLVLQRLNSDLLRHNSSIPTRVHFLVETSAPLQSQ